MGQRSGCPASRAGSRLQAHGVQIYDLAPRLLGSLAACGPRPEDKDAFRAKEKPHLGLFLLRDQGALPLDPATFEKVDETFSFGFLGLFNWGFLGVGV